MLERGFKFGKLDLYKSDATEFLIDGDSLIPPFSAMDGLGDNVAKQLVKARAEGEFLSKTELRKRGGLSTTLVDKMDEMGILGNMPEDNQLSLFDDYSKIFLLMNVGNFHQRQLPLDQNFRSFV